jgi:penicillin-binding protein 1C
VTRRRRNWIVAAAVAALAAVAITAGRVPYDRADLDYTALSSVRVTARDGSPLRVTLGGAGTRAEWVPLSALGPRVLQATLAAEDRRFFAHPGVDLLATARAAWTNLRARRVVAGGSTLTQQLAGLVWPEPRTVRGKLREAVRALRLEVDCSKRDILEQYLNRVPYGPGVHGIAAASRRAFARAPDQLSASQAATLAALPQSPDRLARPSQRAALRARRDRILAAMRRRGELEPEAYAEAVASALELEATPAPFGAPHFADWVLQSLPPSLQRAARLETTLDPGLQAEAEGIVRSHLMALRGRGVHEMAVVVQAIATGEILALVGSPAWEASQVNGALALRQPGSALKPFLYAQAFAAGMSAADLLADLPFAALDGGRGEVAPRNYDGRWHGPVRAREALASSFNVPAVRLQERLGTQRVLAGLRRAGLSTLEDDAETYGLGLVLGVGEVTLVDLTNAYAGLARGGEWREPVLVRGAADAVGGALPLAPPRSRRWLDPASAFVVADVLADDAARVPGFGAGSPLDLPFPAVVKTGTSTDYRNSWCVGFGRDHVVGVWLGNFDGSSLHGLAGASGAGPVFRSLMLRLHARGAGAWEPAVPPAWRRQPVCTLSGARPERACPATLLEWFAPGAWDRREACAFHRWVDGERAVEWPVEYRDWARGNAGTGSVAALAAAHPTRVDASDGPRIVSPLEGAVYFCDPRLGSASAVRFVPRDARPGDAWILDGKPLPSRPDGSALWPPAPGTHHLQLRRADAVHTVQFSVR